jgi:hypothetical protein
MGATRYQWKPRHCLLDVGSFDPQRFCAARKQRRRACPERFSRRPWVVADTGRSATENLGTRVGAQGQGERVRAGS